MLDSRTSERCRNTTGDSRNTAIKIRDLRTMTVQLTMKNMLTVTTPLTSSQFLDGARAGSYSVSWSTRSEAREAPPEVAKG